MKTDSFIKVILLLILFALIYIGFVVTKISKTTDKINNHVDSIATDGTSGGRVNPKLLQLKGATFSTTTDSSSGHPPVPHVTLELVGFNSGASDSTSGGSGSGPKNKKP